MAKLNIKGLGVHIKTADFDKSRKFYESLGFKAVFGFGNEEFRSSLAEGVASAPEKYRGLIFQIREGITLEIGEGHIAIKPEVFKESIASPKVSAMVHVDSLEPLFTNPDIKITYPVRHYYWGNIEAALRDPDGFVVIFITPYSEEELEIVKKYVEVEEVKANG